MTILDDVLDIVLFIVVLALMLPVMLGQLPTLRSLDVWGFAQADDKTMKTASGTIESESYLPQGFTAAELLLITRVADTPALPVNTYILPDGTAVTIIDEYPTIRDSYTDLAQESASPSVRYHLQYDSGAGVWRVTAV